MKSITITIALFFMITAFSQDIDESIEVYESGNYEQAVLMLNRILKQGTIETSQAKGFYCRAMARKKLEKKDPDSYALGVNPFSAIVYDFNKAKELDASLTDLANEELATIHPILIKKANKTVKGISSAKVDELRIGRIESAIAYFHAAYNIKSTFEINEQLGLLYQAMGDYYYSTRETETTYKKAFVLYEKAIKHLEEANEEYPMSSEVQSAIKAVSILLSEGGSKKLTREQLLSDQN